MMKLSRTLAVAALSATVFAGALTSANAAMPLPSISPAVQQPASPSVAGPSDQAQVTEVQYWRDRRGWGPGPGPRPGWGRPGWGPRPGYYGGYRGYRDYRPGYRHYNGYWFPLAAFGAGALIGGAIASEPRYVEPAPRYSGGINPQHYQWCSARYRSYDPGSNTFQPYNGPRQQCYSPYY